MRPKSLLAQLIIAQVARVNMLNLKALERIKSEFVGKLFGRLTVLRVIEQSPIRQVECVCECGNEKTCFIGGLRSGDTKSCGCLRVESSKSRYKDLTNQKFGKLLVLSKAGNAEGKKKDLLWKCICDCGNVKIARSYKLTCGEVRSCGCICRSKGKDHFNWKSTILEADRLNKRGTVKNPKYEAWRSKVFERDDYTCQISGVKGGNIVAHHIYAWNSYPELRFEEINGVTLDAKIHKEFHKRYGRGGNTKDQFEQFKAEWLNS
jgi:hypothetical protein